MSDIPSEEINEVEATVDPIAVGLPLSLQALSRQQMSQWMQDALRKPKEQPDVEQQPEL